MVLEIEAEDWVSPLVWAFRKTVHHGKKYMKEWALTT
jgi:hypothetical protein